MGIQGDLLIKKMSPQLLVADLERAVSFYTNKLGFDIEFWYEDFYAGIIKNGCSVHLKHGDPCKLERQSKRTSNHLDIVFSVVNVEELFKQFQLASIDIVQPLCERSYGKEFYIADVDGYILAFLEE